MIRRGLALLVGLLVAGCTSAATTTVVTTAAAVTDPSTTTTAAAAASIPSSPTTDPRPSTTTSEAPTTSAAPSTAGAEATDGTTTTEPRSTGATTPGDRGGSGSTTPGGGSTIVDVIGLEPDLSTFLEAATAAGLLEELTGEGPFTVFVPDDAAFEALPAGDLEALLGDPERLEEVLLHHVVPGEYPGAALASEQTLTTAQGGEVTITGEGDTVMVDGAKVLQSDLLADNGVIHVIDAVLLLPG